MYANECVKADVPCVCLRVSEEMFIVTNATLSKMLYSRGDLGYSTIRTILGCCHD